MTESEQVAESGFGQKIQKWINHTDLLYVIGGGALGGFLMPLVHSFLKAKAPFSKPVIIPGQFDAWILAALLGAICAGVVIYTLSYSENNNRRQVFFISLLAGLTFPGFLSGALDIEKLGDDVKGATTQAAGKLDSEALKNAGKREITKVANEATIELQEALTEVDASALQPKDKEIVEKTASGVVDELLATAEIAGGNDSDITENVRDVFKTASEQGYVVNCSATTTAALNSLPGEEEYLKSVCKKNAVEKKAIEGKSKSNQP